MLIVNGQITKNFNLNEFVCKSGKAEMLINEDVIAHIQRLQRFRDWFNRPMQITSGYRTPEYNKSVGGVNDSQHVLGLATDINHPADYPREKERLNEYRHNVQNYWADLCKADGVRGGCGWYNGFFHLDSRHGSGALVVWYG